MLTTRWCFIIDITDVTGVISPTPNVGIIFPLRADHSHKPTSRVMIISNHIFPEPEKMIRSNGTRSMAADCVEQRAAPVDWTFASGSYFVHVVEFSYATSWQG